MIPPSCATSPPWGMGRIAMTRSNSGYYIVIAIGGCPGGGGKALEERSVIVMFSPEHFLQKIPEESSYFLSG